MALNQAMMFSFLERVGIDHGFSRQAVTGVLIVLGFITLIPAPLAAILEKRLPPRGVLMTGPVLQVILVFAITLASAFPLFAVAAVLYAPVMIFTHTFAFGVLSKLDPSARALAGTPAMLMIGAAIGPILGGTLVQFFGYSSLGIAALIISAFAVILYSRVQAPAASVAAAQGVAR
jgi:predicted MFS family arabinose efflux permease